MVSLRLQTGLAAHRMSGGLVEAYRHEASGTTRQQFLVGQARRPRTSPNLDAQRAGYPLRTIQSRKAQAGKHR